MPRPRLFLCLTLIACLSPGLVSAAPVRVAVASNFATTLQLLGQAFTAQTGHRLLISPGSTGKHFAQIANGAAFDVFLAADAERPALLEARGVGVPGSRFAYAEGRLVLVAPGADPGRDPREYLAAGGFRRLAIANPRLAPYGLAARQLLEGWRLWGELQHKLVSGENVAQAFQFVATGNAEAGLVALSQIRSMSSDAGATHWILPSRLHAPISQHALLLRQGDAAEAFIGYLRSDAAADILRAAGYQVPKRP
jgi:molybdate transport system substrate-binding protein